MRKRKTGALAVLLVFMMAFANIFGMMPAISVAAQEEKQQEVTVERASELVYGEQYLLVGGTAGKTSGSEDDLYAVVGATTHSGSKAGSVLDKVEVSGLDFSDAENQLTAQETNLWTAVEGENGTVALYNKASNKYMHFESGNRAVTLTDEATYYEAVLTDHHAAGKALAFRLGTWYLNFSESQNGFCAYDASTYSQNETKDTNQYAFYHVKKAEVSTTSTVTRATAITAGKKYMLVGGDSKSSTYQAVTAQTHAGSKVNSVLTGAEIAGLDLSDLSNEVTVSNEYLWTVKAGSTEGTVALYNEAAGKYLNFAEGARPVTLGDEPTDFTLAQTDHHVAGIAAAFHLNGYYLNYSDSQKGFCAYDASTYSQNETKDTNQYALYEVKTGATPTPDPDPSEGDAKATLLFCSDFQTGTEVSPYQSVSDVPESLTSVMTNISKEMYDDGFTQIDNVLAVGDYTAYSGRYNYDADATIGIQAFKNIIQNRWSNTNQFLFIQGNHDQANYPFDEGAHEYSDYIVYCINTTYNTSEMGGFPWMQGSTGSEAQVKKAARKLGDYLDSCITAGETRPIFIMVHLPLHFSGRTSSLYGNGDNVYSSYLFDVINTAAEDLDIVYLYGHNHSKGWDNYLGGSRVFKKPGDTILIPDLTKKSGSTTDSYKKEELNFTYMNAGYIGYFHDATAADELTATVCQVYDNKLVLRRYSEDGLIDIGSVGKNNTRYNDSSLIPATELAHETVSPVQIDLNQVAVPSVTIEAAGGKVGEKVALKAVVKHIKADSYEWNIEDPEIGEITAEDNTASVFCKKAGSTNVKVTVTDTDGNTTVGQAVLEVSYDQTAGASAKIQDADGNAVTTAGKNERIILNGALAGIPEVVSYKWSVSDSELAEIEDADSAETAVTFKGKGEVTVTLLVTYKDAQGQQKTVTARTKVVVSEIPSYRRVSEIESGKSYLIIGSSGKALNTEISPLGGVACIAGTQIQAADLGNSGDVLKGDYGALLWKIEKDANGQYTLYNTAAKKYLSLSVSDRSIELADTPVKLSVEKGTLSNGSGSCVAFYNGTMYLNHSKSKQAYCGYSGETVTNANNQFAIYELVGEEVVKNTYTVTFNSKGGSTAAAQTVEKGAKVTEPSAPTLEGYTFAGWYTDEACTTPWNFEADVVNGNMELYAKWNEVQVVIDTTELQKAVAEMDQVDLEKYEKDAAYDAFTAALQNAKAVLEDPESEQAVAEAKTALTEAYANLKLIQTPDPEPVIDTTELQKLVDEMDKVDLEKYEKDAAYDAFVAALQNAKAVLADPESEQTVADAKAALAAAYANLKLIQTPDPKPEPTPEPKPDPTPTPGQTTGKDDKTPGTGKDNKASGNETTTRTPAQTKGDGKVVPTGDNTEGMLVVLCMMTAAAGVIVIRKRAGQK